MHVNSLSLVKCGYSRLTDSAVAMMVAGTVIDSVTTLFFFNLRSESMLSWCHMARLTGSMAASGLHSDRW